ncbi:MAG: hypothetical protein WC655_28695, partial [Candidatus Hydrogenedentales bacterium]
KSPWPSFLSWDTEGGKRIEQNLLRKDARIALRVRVNDAWIDATSLPVTGPDHALFHTVLHLEYGLQIAPGVQAYWTVGCGDGGGEGPSFTFGSGKDSKIQAAEVLFPFDATVTPTTALPHAWNEDGTMTLPAVINAPDFGPVLLTNMGGKPIHARLEGSREQHAVDLVVELEPTGGVIFRALDLPTPGLLKDASMWRDARRGWLNALQCSAKWGDPNRPYSSPAGLLGNNVISDPASPSIWFYADQSFWIPQLAEGVNVMDHVRRTLDWWLDTKVLPNGKLIGYWDKTDFLDGNAGPLIAAWDYVEGTGDTAWLTKRIERLEFVASYLEQRDIDNDGLIEAEQSGNANTLKDEQRSCAWWDALNCGHKDAYTNAIIYRGFRCLADLEKRAGRTEQAARFTDRANRLKAAYFPTFYPETGWLVWWISADGAKHDYASPTTNGIAIEYGLVEPEKGREILAKLRAKIKEVGFTRFDLGVPPQLIPVLRADYLQPACGCPEREDGTDTFGYYMNGGITAGQVLHFLAAHYVVGDPEPADEILRAMLTRQAQGLFQNGAVNEYPKGIDWTTWDGKPAGYEGYLADSFRFLQAVLLREAPFRERLYRPLSPPR